MGKFLSLQLVKLFQDGVHRFFVDGKAHHFQFDVIFVKEVISKLRIVGPNISRAGAGVFNQIPVVASSFVVLQNSNQVHAVIVGGCFV